MLGCLGDLVEDVVVRLAGPINVGSDTPAVITRRRGGSAANVAAAAARAGHPSLFIGQVGDDPTGARLVSDLESAGVEVRGRRGGRTGTVVALVDPTGERSMLSDRGSSTDLDDPDPRWLDELRTLHVPVYSLVVEPLATTACQLVGWAHDRDLTVSIDVSSVSVVESFGVEALVDLLAWLRPEVLLANADEARCLTNHGLVRIAAPLTIVKQGGGPALVAARGQAVVEVPTPPLDVVVDTTGAGDAFAAGLLVALELGGHAVDAVRAGHRSAAAAITTAGRPAE